MIVYVGNFFIKNIKIFLITLLFTFPFAFYYNNKYLFYYHFSLFKILWKSSIFSYLSSISPSLPILYKDEFCVINLQGYVISVFQWQTLIFRPSRCQSFIPPSLVIYSPVPSHLFHRPFSFIPPSLLIYSLVPSHLFHRPFSFIPLCTFSFIPPCLLIYSTVPSHLFSRPFSFIPRPL